MSSAPRRHRPWLIALPLAIFLIIAAGWTAAWVYIRGEVERGFTAWLENETRSGRRHECPSRSIGGYPFLIELRCTAPVLEVATPQGPARIRTASVAVTALLYNPRHVLVDLAAPLTVEQGGLTHATLGFARGQASFRVNDVTVERLSLVLERATLSLANASRQEASATLLEIHARHDPSVAGPVRDFEVNLIARGLATAGLPPEQAAQVDGRGIVRRWPLFQEPGPQGPIADWARGGGSVEISELRINRGNGLMRIAGSLGFSPAGRADGQLRANLAEPGALLAGVAIAGAGNATAFLGPALALVGRPAEVEGRRGVEVLVRLDDGVLSLGAVQLAVFPPVF